jgi:adenylate kinase
MNIVLLGAPGAGKGTQAKRIQADHSVAHISAGDLLRDAVSRGTPEGLEARTFMESGSLVPDSLILSLIGGKVGEIGSGFILDGFPRTIDQAKSLDDLIDIDIVLSIDVPFSALLARLTGRRSCPSCGGVFHMIFNPPTVEGICDLCGAELVHRADDNESTVTARIETYVSQTESLITYYENQGILKHIDGNRNIDLISDDIRKVLSHNFM